MNDVNTTDTTLSMITGYTKITIRAIPALRERLRQRKRAVALNNSTYLGSDCQEEFDRSVTTGVFNPREDFESYSVVWAEAILKIALHHSQRWWRTFGNRWANKEKKYCETSAMHTKDNIYVPEREPCHRKNKEIAEELKHRNAAAINEEVSV